MPTARERVRAALTFNYPDRAPRDLWMLPYIQLFRRNEYESLLRRYPMDISVAQLNPGWKDEVSAVSASAGRYTDEWGSVWHVGEPGVIGEVKRPALADWSALATYQLPWHLVRGRDFSYVNRSCGQLNQFVLSNATARPFERLQFLRGSENLYVDIGYGTAEFRRLLEMVHEYYLEDIRGWCQSDVDAIFFLDDWGSNRRLLIHPQTWRELFKPLYREYCDMIHAAGKFAFFHTDGHTEAIFGDFVEIGIDAVNAQLFTMDIEELARQHKGKITFWGEIDRQRVLPFGTLSDVRDAVRRVRLALDDGSGGVIAQCEWGKDNSRQTIETVYESWLEPVTDEASSRADLLNGE